jgi:hypothetical protein
MTKVPKKVPKALIGGSSYAMDKHHRIVREMPRHVETRMQNIAARNEILNSAEAYSALWSGTESRRTCIIWPRGCSVWRHSTISVSWTPRCIG